MFFFRKKQKITPDHYVWEALRLGMGWIFFWAFIDKLWGLGFATLPEDAWLNGGSPTYGFLKFGTKGPFVELYQSMAGHPVVDGLFMLGLLLIGLSLLLGIGVRVAGYSGALMMILMYTAGSIWPEHNPFLDEHLMYAVVLIGFTLVPTGECLGFAKWWTSTELVKKYPILR